MRSDIASSECQFSSSIVDLPPTLALVLPICRALGLIEAVDALCPMKNGRHLTHGQVAEFVVLSILQVPKRPPLYKMNEWAADYALQTVYGHCAEAFNDDRIGRALDEIATKGSRIEQQIVATAMSLYELRPQAIHWDLMHLAFSDGKQESDLVCRGYGHGQLNERQVQVSVHMDSESGLPVHHEIFAGRSHQAPLAADLLHTLQGRLGNDLTIVADRAGIGYDNVVAYRSKGARHLSPLQITEPQMREQLAAVLGAAFQQLRYRSMHDPTPVNYYYATKVLLQPSKKAVAQATKAKRDKPEALTVDALFILNIDGQLDDAQKRRERLKKTLKRLRQIKDYIHGGSKAYRNHAFALRQITKAITRQQKGLITYQLTHTEGQLSLAYAVDRKALRRAQRLDGRHILIHALADTHTPDEIFELYRNQSALESQFRSLNSDLQISPSWLHKEGRIRALTLLYFLALIIYSILGLLARRARLDTEHYHKMTPREMLQRCHALRLIVKQEPGQDRTCELQMPDRQRDIRRALNLPSILRWLQLPP